MNPKVGMAIIIDEQIRETDARIRMWRRHRNISFLLVVLPALAVAAMALMRRPTLDVIFILGLNLWILVMNWQLMKRWSLMLKRLRRAREVMVKMRQVSS